MARISYQKQRGDDGWFDRCDKYVVGYTYHVVGPCGWSEQHEDTFDDMKTAVRHADNLKPRRGQDAITNIEVWHIQQSRTKTYSEERRN